MPRTLVANTILLLFLAACGGSGGMGPDETENPGPGGTGAPVTRTIKATPSFAADIQEIFNRRGCSDSLCHGSSAQADLVLTSGMAYGNLVNVTASQSSLFRIKPGDPANSYLIRKVEGSATFGDKMPPGGSPLDNIDLTNLRNWVSSGAQNN